MGIGAVEKNMLLILDIINHQYYTGHRWGNYFDSLSLSQNIGCGHEVLKQAVIQMTSRGRLRNMYLGRI